METLGAVRTAEVDMMVEGCWEEAAKGVNTAVERVGGVQKEATKAVAGRVVAVKGEAYWEEARAVAARAGEEMEEGVAVVVGTRAEVVRAVAG